MKTHLTELDAIARDSAAPNFENTIAALERSGRALDGAATI
jgi:peptidyl-dipeptidase Dcp